MKLDTYLRSIVNKKILRYLNLCKCEKCGSTNNLEIHHKDLYFFEMVDKTLNELGIPYYQDIKLYTDSELENISTYLLGLHMKNEYSILCSNCHTLHHRENVKRRNNKIDKINIDSVLNFLHKLEGKFIYLEDRIILNKLLNTRYAGIRSLNSMIDNVFGEEYPFRLYSKDKYGKSYHDRRRRLEDGNLNPNRDKTYWMLREIET